VVSPDLPAEEREKIYDWQKRIASHVAVHMLDAQTLSYGLHDSPIGLLAWLIKGRRSWATPGATSNRASTRIS